MTEVLIARRSMFCLSRECMHHLVEMKCTTLQKTLKESWTKYLDDEWEEAEKIGIDRLMWENYNHYAYKDGYIYSSSDSILFRSDPKVIQIVQEVGIVEAGFYPFWGLPNNCGLKIIDVPLEIDRLEICDESGGLGEYIGEKHQTWS